MLMVFKKTIYFHLLSLQLFSCEHAFSSSQDNRSLLEMSPLTVVLHLCGGLYYWSAVLRIKVLGVFSKKNKTKKGGGCLSLVMIDDFKCITSLRQNLVHQQEMNQQL